MADNEHTPMLAIEVAYASETQQALLCCRVPAGTSVRQAFIQSGLADHIAELSSEMLATVPLGIFGRAVHDPEHQQVQDGERIEGYRPIKCDPKQMRRMRAASRPLHH